MQSPLDAHWVVVQRILRYLSSTLEHGLHLKWPPKLKLVGFCDSDWAADRDDRRTTFDLCVYFCSNLMSWQSKKQQIVDRSTAESEYRNIANFWSQRLLGCAHFSQNYKWILFILQLSGVTAQQQFQFLRILSSTREPSILSLTFILLERKFFKKYIELHHVPTRDQIADILTKAISSSKFLELRSELRVDPYLPWVWEGVLRTNYWD